MALLFDTSKPNISMHILNVLQDKELDENSVVKDYLTTASDGFIFTASSACLTFNFPFSYNCAIIYT